MIGILQGNVAGFFTELYRAFSVHDPKDIHQPQNISTYVEIFITKNIRIVSIALQKYCSI